MKYENLIQRSDSEFKRLTGVTPVLFHEMLQVITEAESRKIKSGRPHTLSLYPARLREFFGRGAGETTDGPGPAKDAEAVDTARGSSRLLAQTKEVP